MKTTIHVKGMSCGHCVSAVKGALEQVNGISSVEVTLDNGQVDVTYDEAEVTIEEIERVIEEQGYDVV